MPWSFVTRLGVRMSLGCPVKSIYHDPGERTAITSVWSADGFTVKQQGEKGEKNNQLHLRLKSTRKLQIAIAARNFSMNETAKCFNHTTNINKRQKEEHEE